MKSQIYLAGGIADLSWEEAQGWRDQFSEIIDETCNGRWCCFDPCKHIHDFCEVISEEEALVYDLDHLRHSRIMLVSFEHTQKSIGTAIEIGVALENRIPIIGYNPNKIDLHPWIRRSCTHICETWEGLWLFLCNDYLNEGGY